MIIPACNSPPEVTGLMGAEKEILGLLIFNSMVLLLLSPKWRQMSCKKVGASWGGESKLPREHLTQSQRILRSNLMEA